MESWRIGALALLLATALQLHSCWGLNLQRNEWVTKHLQRPPGGVIHAANRESRHLEELEAPTRGGWKASLIHPHFKQGTNNFTILQKIQHDVERTLERARALDHRVKRTRPSKGRKLLNYVSDVQATGGSFSMEIALGTPPQRLSAIADTGSDLVWVQCSPCDLCFESTADFLPSASASYAPLGCADCQDLGNNQLTCTPNCKYSYRYGDRSSTQGDFSLESLTLNGTDGVSTLVPEFRFGCGLVNNGTFSNTDGIVGLARGPISFTSQIAPVLNNVSKFSYCLMSIYDEASEVSPLFFGAAAEPNGTVETSYTPLLEPYDTSLVPYYYVNLTDITIGGVPLGIPPSAFVADTEVRSGGVIFDSGTTYTILSGAAYSAVVAAFESAFSGQLPKVDLSAQTGFGLCYDVSALTEVRVPTFAFNFEGADMDLPVDNFMLSFTIENQGDHYICLSLLDPSRFDLGISIIGNVQQQNFQVVYDEDNLRIGWVLTDCKSL